MVWCGVKQQINLNKKKGREVPVAVAGLSRWLGGRERWGGGVCDLYIFGVFRAEQVSCVEAAHPKTRKKSKKLRKS